MIGETSSCIFNHIGVDYPAPLVFERILDILWLEAFGNKD